jgi:hypothetical protein
MRTKAPPPEVRADRPAAEAGAAAGVKKWISMKKTSRIYHSLI